jgi:hypothetical protein
MNHEMYLGYLEKSKTPEDRQFWKSAYLKQLTGDLNVIEHGIKYREQHILQLKDAIQKSKIRAKTIKAKIAEIEKSKVD